MNSVVLFDSATGEIKGALVASPGADAAEMINANTPAGAATLALAPNHPAIRDQSGWIVANGVVQQIVPTDAEVLNRAQSIQSAVIEAGYQNATFATPVAYLGTTFWTDQNSQFLLMGAVIGFQQGTPEGFLWWDAKGVPISMTLAELQGLYQAILNQVNTNFVRRKSLLAEVQAATLVVSVQAVVW